MKENSVKKNFIYQVIYNIATLVIPLIVTPFISRALLENEIGKFTFSRSIASYFVVFAMMGIVKYGQRAISINNGNDEDNRKTFWSLFYTHLCFSLVSLVAYVLTVTIFIGTDQILFWVETIYVASAIFDITWFFYGKENFGRVAICSVVIKLIEALLYIYLVKTPSDVILYSIINCSVYLITQIVLFCSILKECKFRR